MPKTFDFIILSKKKQEKAVQILEKHKYLHFAMYLKASRPYR